MSMSVLFDHRTQIDTPHPYEQLNARLERVQRRTSVLGGAKTAHSLFNDSTNSFESACRGEEKGTADIARWCSVYCGGSKPVMKILKKVGKECGMHSEFETFNW